MSLWKTVNNHLAKFGSYYLIGGLISSISTTYDLQNQVDLLRSSMAVSAMSITVPVSSGVAVQTSVALGQRERLQMGTVVAANMLAAKMVREFAENCGAEGFYSDKLAKCELARDYVRNPVGGGYTQPKTDGRQPSP